jgi:hypothetical protein
MEVWGGSQSTSRSVELGGLDAWVYSKPFGGAGRGGDVYYASACATGRINRLLLADVSGHGDAVATMAISLRNLMRRYVNFLDQTKLVRSMNHQFAALSRKGCFATAVATTFFTPTRRLSVCNAGHPRPFLYRAAENEWSILEREHDDGPAPKNIPLGILALTDYEQLDIQLEGGDLVLCYTDALTEAHDTDGEMLGEDRLLRIVASIDPDQPDLFIEALLGGIRQLHEKNLSADDVTVMLLRPHLRKPRISARQKFWAAMRLVGSLILGINPRAQRPPLPDLKLANIGGAIFPPLSKKWRPASREGQGRAPRRSIASSGRKIPGK